MYCTLYSIIRQGHKSRQEKGESRKWGGGGGIQKRGEQQMWGLGGIQKGEFFILIRIMLQLIYFCLL